MPPQPLAAARQPPPGQRKLFDDHSPCPVLPTILPLTCAVTPRLLISIVTAPDESTKPTACGEGSPAIFANRPPAISAPSRLLRTGQRAPVVVASISHLPS